MRILMIGTSQEVATRCAECIATHWPAARLEGPDGAAQVRPDDWTGYDALLVGHHAPAHDGSAWLAAQKKRLAELPPVIMLSGSEGAGDALGVVREGAADHIEVSRLNPHRLVGAINDAILVRARRQDSELARQRLAKRYAPPSVTVVPDIQNVGTSVVDGPEINGYRMLRQIGEGGTSRVYLAERLPRLGQPVPDPRHVVLKVVDARSISDQAFIERFIREYRIISTVQNEHVARIYDQGVTDDHLYIAMEYFARGDLKQRMEQKGSARLTPLQAVRLTAQIARALDAIHSAGVIHRDLKPHNIMFRDSQRLALVDFGLAKREGEKTITASAGVNATPLYMSPEQCVGRPQDARSDLYSLGVILYEMLTAKRLFDADNMAAIAFQHVHAEVPRLPQPLSGFQSVIDRLLAKDPERRFQSARELFAKIAM